MKPYKILIMLIMAVITIQGATAVDCTNLSDCAVKEWSVPIYYSSSFTADSLEDNIYVSSTILQKIDADDGSSFWNVSLAKSGHIDFYNGYIYHASGNDVGHSYIRKYSTSGNIIWTSEDYGDGSFVDVDYSDEGFFSAWGAGVGVDGDLKKHNSTGGELWSTRDFGAGVIAVADSGYVYVGGSVDGSSYVFKITNYGSQVWNVSVDSVSDLVIDAYENIYIIESDTDLKKFDSDGNLVYSTDVIGSSGRAVQVSPNGENVFVITNAGAGSIIKYDGTGNLTYNFSRYDVGFLLGQPEEIVLIDDYVYLTDDDDELLKFQDLTHDNTALNLSNDLPIIINYTISDTNPDIGQYVDISITEGNVDAEDVVHFGYKCDGTGSFVDTISPSFRCVYNSSYSGQTFNLTIAISDNFHVGEWNNETNISMTVSGFDFSSGTLRVLVLDDETNDYVGSADVSAYNSVYGYFNGSTNVYGEVTVYPTSVDYYTVTASKTGYYSNSELLYADGSFGVIRLTPELVNGTTSLIVSVIDEDTLTPVANSLVSYINTITYDYDYKYTGVNGQAIFTSLDEGSFVITASSDGYDQKDTTSYVVNGLVNEVSISLDNIGAGSFSGGARVDRNCVDNKIWLCGDVEHSCSIDSDCLSDSCNIAGRCSRFNYSQCDAIDMPRGQRCVSKLSANNVMNNVTDFFLSNLLWVILILIIVIGVGLVFTSWRR